MTRSAQCHRDEQSLPAWARPFAHATIDAGIPIFLTPATCGKVLRDHGVHARAVYAALRCGWA